MKVTLVAPRTGERGSGDEAKPLFPPLSLMTVAALTPEDVEVDIADEAVRPIDFDTGADLIGITATTAAAIGHTRSRPSSANSENLWSWVESTPRPCPVKQRLTQTLYWLARLRGSGKR